MSTEDIITITVAVLSSGLISTLLNRHWSVVDKKKLKKERLLKKFSKKKPSKS